MFTEKDISVVIPAYNAKDYLTRLIDSLEQQLPDPGAFETIVVDDGSSDSTVAWLKQYAGPLNLNLVSHERNLGRSAARNSGINKATRAIILFLDSDVVASKRLVAEHAALHTDKPTAFVGGVYFSKEYEANGFTQYLETRGVHRAQNSGEILPRYFLSGHSSVPRNSLMQISGFDLSIEYGEDIDLGIRLSEIGVEIRGVPEISVIHQHVRSLRDAAQITFRFGFRSLPILCKRHPFLVNDLKLSLLLRGGFKAMLLRAAFSAPIFNLVLTLASIGSNFRLPSPVYSYILYRSYACGYLLQIKSNSIK